jgi:hypothetical protein
VTAGRREARTSDSPAAQPVPSLAVPRGDRSARSSAFSRKQALRCRTPADRLGGQQIPRALPVSRGPDALCADPLQLAGDRFRLPRGRSANQCIGDKGHTFARRRWRSIRRLLSPSESVGSRSSHQRQAALFGRLIPELDLPKPWRAGRGRLRLAGRHGRLAALRGRDTRRGGRVGPAVRLGDRLHGWLRWVGRRDACRNGRIGVFCAHGSSLAIAASYP